MMKTREMVTLKNTLLASFVLLLTACGGGGGDDAIANNSPSLDLRETINPILARGDTDSECKWLDSDKAGVKEFRCDFSETTTFKGAQDNVTPDGLTLEIDLLTGVVDQDPLDAFSVKEVKFVFPGVACVGFSSITIERTYPECGTLETIRNILAEKLSDEELREYDELSDAEALKLYQTRIKLSLPKFTDEYGFQIKSRSVLVTPTLLIPVLNKSERAEVHLEYTVTDGKDDLIRRTRIVVNGESSAPIYEGPDLSIPEGQTVVVTGEFETLADLNLLGGVVDPDIEQIDFLQDVGGLLTDRYKFSDLRLQRLGIANFVPVSGTTGVRGASSGAGYRVSNVFIDPITKRPVVVLEIDTEFFESQLKEGEFRDLIFEYDIVDSSPADADIERQQFVERLKRTIAVRVQAPGPGVNFAGDLVKNFGVRDPKTRTFGLGSAVTFALDEGTFKARSNKGTIVVEDIVSADADTFGVEIDPTPAQARVTIDSTAFLNVKPGEKKVLTFDYMLSDGTLKTPRKLIVNIDGVDLNLLKDVDFGFESGKIAEKGMEPDGGGWSVINTSSTGGFVAEAAPSGTPFDAGSFVMKVDKGFSAMGLLVASFPQELIVSNSSISVNFWVKQTSLDTKLSFSFFPDDDLTKRFQQFDLPKVLTTDWEEHTVYLRASSEGFNGQTDVGFYLDKNNSDEVLIDNVRILPWRNDRFFDFIEDGTFDSGTLGKFVTNASGSVEANKEAKFSGDNGLFVDTTDQTEATTVTLPSTAFKQGISNGSRYRFTANLRYPEQSTGDDLVVNVSLVDEATPSSKLTKSIIVDQDFWTNRSSITFNVDALNKDNKDWSKVDVALELEFPNKDQVVYVDALRFYQVP